MSKPPAGYFERIFSIDCETTGLNFNTDDPSIGHQAVSWGIVVADTRTLKPIEELYVEIKWNEASLESRLADKKFGKFAEGIHGLTFDHLEKHGVDEEDAVCDILELFQKYNANGVVRTLGHNVHLFDLPFLRSMLRRHQVELKFGNRHYDTNSGGFMCFETYTSNELFELCGHDPRGSHNALDDAKMALDCARQMRIMMNSLLGD